MDVTHLEVTYGGVLAAIDEGVERRLTSEEFSQVFERMADRLHDIEGLVGPGLWGQASNGRIEMEFCLADACDAAATERAMAVVSEVGAAGGVAIGACGPVDGHCSGSLVGEPYTALSGAPEGPQFVLNGARHATEALAL